MGERCEWRPSTGDEARWNERVLDAINAVFLAALTTDRSSEVAERCLAIAEGLTGSEFGFVNEVNANCRYDCIALTDPGWRACRMPQSEHVVLPVDLPLQGFGGRVVAESRSLIVNDPDTHPDRVAMPAGHPPIHSFLGVPLVDGGRTIGLIALANKPGGYGDIDRVGVERLASAFVSALQRKRAEEALRQSEQRFRAIADYTYDWENWVGPDGKLLWVNPGVERVTGYSVADCLAMPGFPLPIIHPDDRAMVDGYFRDATRGSTGSDIVLRIIRRDGACRWVSVSWQPISDDEGRPMGHRSSLRDITESRLQEEERDRLRAKLQEMERLESLATLAGGVAQDYNSLLTAILTAATMLELDLRPQDEPMAENIRDIITAAERAAALSQQMLAYSGHGRLAAQQSSLSHLVREMLPSLQGALPPGATLDARLQADLPLVVADERMLRQALYQLFTNAVESLGPEGGRVSIATSVVQVGRNLLESAVVDDGLPPGSYVCLEVSDNGRGIDPLIQGRIFDPFFSTKLPGRGLGLAAVLGTVRGHRGAILVASEPAKGSCFRVLLPRVDTEPPPEAN